MRRRGPGITLALAALLTAAACTGAPEPTAPDPIVPEPPATAVESPPPRPSPSDRETGRDPSTSVPPPEPLPSPPYPPDLRAEDSEENAVLAAEYFVALMNYAHSTGDTAPLRQVSADSCEPCHAFITDVEDLYDDGGYAVGNVVSLGEPAPSRSKDGNAWEVAVDWNLSEGVRVPAEGETIDLEPLTLADQRLTVGLAGDEWIYLSFAGAED